jgi:hypothetical protein
MIEHIKLGYLSFTIWIFNMFQNEVKSTQFKGIQIQSFISTFNVRNYFPPD